MVSEADGQTGMHAAPQVSTVASHRLQRVLNSDLVKDGLMSTEYCNDIVKAEILQLSTVLPTMWIGAESGQYVNSLTAEV